MVKFISEESTDAETERGYLVLLDLKGKGKKTKWMYLEGNSDIGVLAMEDF